MSTAPCMIHHVALKVANIPYFIRFFEDVFSMSVTKTRGEEGAWDSVWLDGGVQLIASDCQTPRAGTMDHVSFLVPDVEETKKKAEKYGAAPVPGKREHWFQIPEQILFELKTE